MTGPRRFVIMVDGRRHKVVVDPQRDGEPRRVHVDGELCHVTELGPGEHLVRRELVGAQQRINLPLGAAPGWASVGGVSLPIEVLTARQAAHAEAVASACGGASGRATIEAPMPGRVVKVLVANGDTVEIGGPLLIIEAMKMENEIHAPVAGRVARLEVAEGSTVDPGQVLCVLEPQDDASDLAT